MSINNYRAILTFSLSLLLSGCTDLFFFPTKDLNIPPDRYGISYEKLELQHPSGVMIRGWKLIAEGKAKGTIFYFHGNAQNISYHIGGVYWLPKEGFNVILMDYQGYGPSEGESGVKEAVSDIKLTLTSYQSEARPLIVYGQSIGASLVVPALSELVKEVKIDGVILESPFASYQEIAREKIGSFWLTWPLQYPLSLLISDRYAPDRYINQLPQVPILMIYSKNDKVVPCHHTKGLYEKANFPKEVWEYEKQPHIGIFQNNETRARFVKYLKEYR